MVVEVRSQCRLLRFEQGGQKLYWFCVRRVGMRAVMITNREFCREKMEQQYYL